MAHNIDMANGRAHVAYLGSRNDVWHRLGQEMKPGMSIEEWAKQAGLDWSAIKVPALADFSGISIGGHTGLTGPLKEVAGECFIARNDTGGILGRATDGYQVVQPAEVLDWFQRYIAVDDRFQLDVAGSLKEGRIIWATATFNGPIDVAGEKHVARLLMSTSFDCTSATINKGTMTRVVCNNTLNAALADKSCEVRTRHNARFNAEAVGKELAGIATGIDSFKAIGDAMAAQHMSKSDTAAFLLAMLGEKHDAKVSDFSTRKKNMLGELAGAYEATVREGTQDGTAWTALNAVTRYVDHSRSSKGDASEDLSRFGSAQFGSGAAMKAKAWNLLTHMEATLASQTTVEPEGAFIDLQAMEARLCQ